MPIRKFSNYVGALASTFEEYEIHVPDLTIRLATVGVKQLDYLLSEMNMYLVVNEYRLYLSTGTTDPLLSKSKLVALQHYIMTSTD